MTGENEVSVAQRRARLREQFWEHTSSGITDYGDAIDFLLSQMSLPTLESAVAEWSVDEDDEGDAESEEAADDLAE